MMLRRVAAWCAQRRLRRIDAQLDELHRAWPGVCRQGTTFDEQELHHRCDVLAIRRALIHGRWADCTGDDRGLFLMNRSSAPPSPR